MAESTLESGAVVSAMIDGLMEWIDEWSGGDGRLVAELRAGRETMGVDEELQVAVERRRREGGKGRRGEERGQETRG
jgi:hypothetical protein